ncbi:MAG: PLP-dependent aminotransferase family protein [Candidatus Promineofilum sp.]|nr:PLP-dependent aminotransferase family protein [Promineifilum sp.]
MELRINREDADPAYRQVYRQLREAILSGALSSGSRLPSSRAMARDVGVARVTILRALEQLTAEGFIESRVGAGTYVAADLPASEIQSDVFRPALTNWGRRALTLQQAIGPVVEGSRPEIDFGFGRSFAERFPYDIWRRLLGRYLSTDDAMLSRYGSAAGFYPLRRALAEYLAQARGVHCTPEEVVIVSGAQQAIDILARLLLEPNDEVLVETPGYRDAYALFQLHQARLVGLPVVSEGLPVDHIPADARPRLAFVTPSHQFPKGGTMPLAPRLALLAWARERGTMIIEDDYDGDLRYESGSLAALQGLDEEGRVIYLGTFSKVLFPALRLGYLVLPRALTAPFVQAKELVDRGAPTLMQAAVADFLAEGHFERHLRHLRRLYGEKRATLVRALDEYLGRRVRYSPVAAGLHVMLYANGEVDEGQLVRDAAERGVRVYGGAPYHLERPAPPSILLGFSGLDEDEIVDGVRRLAEAWPD